MFGRRGLWIAALLLLASCDRPPAARASGPVLNAGGYLSARLPPVDLPIRDLPQETPVWCWAAVSQQIILASRGPEATPPQCALVAVANGAPPQVCCSGPNPQCLRTGSLGQIRGLIRRFGGRASNYAPPTDPLTLYRTLAGGHAVVIALAAGPVGGHVVVARGMSFARTPWGWEPMVHINDPMASQTEVAPFRALARGWQAAIVVD
jgi:hypothetical protein